MATEQKFSTTAPLPQDTTRILEAKILTVLRNSTSGTGGAGITGTGSPEGVVSASPGTLYLDTATDNVYIKRTGSGTTGWLLIISS